MKAIIAAVILAGCGLAFGDSYTDAAYFDMKLAEARAEREAEQVKSQSPFDKVWMTLSLSDGTRMQVLLPRCATGLVSVIREDGRKLNGDIR